MGYDFRLAKNNEIDTIFLYIKKEFNGWINLVFSSGI